MVVKSACAPPCPTLDGSSHRMPPFTTGRHVRCHVRSPRHVCGNVPHARLPPAGGQMWMKSDVLLESQNCRAAGTPVGRVSPSHPSGERALRWLTGVLTSCLKGVPPAACQGRVEQRSGVKEDVSRCRGLSLKCEAVAHPTLSIGTFQGTYINHALSSTRRCRGLGRHRRCAVTCLARPVERWDRP